MRQPLATVSNLAYLASGIFSWNPVKAASMLFLTVASGLFHLTHEDNHRHMDEAAMYLVLCIYTGYEVKAVFNGYGLTILAIFAFAGMVLALMYKKLQSFRVVPALFGCMMVSTVFAEGWIGVWAGVPFLVATGANFAGRRLFERDSTTNDILHSLWHILTAYGFYLI